MRSKNQSHKKRPQRDYSLAFKLQVISEVKKGELSYKQAQFKYGIQGRSTVLTWHRKLSTLDWERVTHSVEKKTTRNILDSTSCNGLYIYTLYPNKLVKRSHPIDKSSFIIIDNKVYPATLDTNKNIIFLDDNREILKRYFSPKQLIEMKRVYSKGIFGISTTEDWFFTPYKH